MNSYYKTYFVFLVLGVIACAWSQSEGLKKEPDAETIPKQPEQTMKRDYFLTRFFDDPIFHMGHLHTPWGHLSRLDRDLLELSRRMFTWDRDFKSLANLFTCPGLVDRTDFFPSVESHVDEETGKYIVNIPLGKNMTEKDVKVSLTEHVMTVEAKKEHVSEDGKSRTYQEFMRKFTLPEKVNATDVKTMLTPEGYLKIEASVPKEALPEPEKPKEIPVIRA